MLFGARYIIRMFSEKITTPDFADILKTENSAAGRFARRVTIAIDSDAGVRPASAVPAIFDPAHRRSQTPENFRPPLESSFQ